MLRPSTAPSPRHNPMPTAHSTATLGPTWSPGPSVWPDGSEAHSFPGQQPITFFPTPTPFHQPTSHEYPYGSSAYPSASIPPVVSPSPVHSVHRDFSNTPAGNESPLPVSDTAIQQPQRRRQQSSRQPQYTSEQWESKREKIKELYLDRNESLPVTMSIMASEYGFNPRSVLLFILRRVTDQI
jgi:hypothetical protein